MLLKLLPVLMLALGIGAGTGAALLLTPKPEMDSPGEPEMAKDTHEESDADPAKTEFVKLNNQFVIPVIQKERVSSLVVLSLSIETRIAMSDVVRTREPKLRDSFLRVLFDHANMGGFNGSFTQSDMLEILRNSLEDVARKELGPDIEGVLITDISRQDT